MTSERLPVTLKDHFFHDPHFLTWDKYEKVKDHITKMSGKYTYNSILYRGGFRLYQRGGGAKGRPGIDLNMGLNKFLIKYYFQLYYT